MYVCLAMHTDGVLIRESTYLMHHTHMRHTHRHTREGRGADTTERKLPGTTNEHTKRENDWLDRDGRDVQTLPYTRQRKKAAEPHTQTDTTANEASENTLVSQAVRQLS